MHSPVEEAKIYKKIAEKLWDILDDIDSLPNILQPDSAGEHEKCWQMMVKRAEKRHKLLKSNGYSLTLPDSTWGKEPETNTLN